MIPIALALLAFLLVGVPVAWWALGRFGTGQHGRRDRQDLRDLAKLRARWPAMRHRTPAPKVVEPPADDEVADGEEPAVVDEPDDTADTVALPPADPEPLPEPEPPVRPDPLNGELPPGPYAELNEWPGTAAMPRMTPELEAEMAAALAWGREPTGAWAAMNLNQKPAGDAALVNTTGGAP